jgi:hypothetical protein
MLRDGLGTLQPVDTRCVEHVSFPTTTATPVTPQPPDPPMQHSSVYYLSYSHLLTPLVVSSRSHRRHPLPLSKMRQPNNSSDPSSRSTPPLPPPLFSSPFYPIILPIFFRFSLLLTKLPPDILPYFRSITEMSEEVLGAIKFQHQNLLHLVDYLRERVGTLTSVVTEARAELEARKRDDKYPTNQPKQILTSLLAQLQH